MNYCSRCFKLMIMDGNAHAFTREQQEDSEEYGIAKRKAIKLGCWNNAHPAGALEILAMGVNHVHVSEYHAL